MKLNEVKFHTHKTKWDKIGEAGNCESKGEKLLEIDNNW